jgi:hypothetical protein
MAAKPMKTVYQRLVVRNYNDSIPVNDKDCPAKGYLAKNAGNTVCTVGGIPLNPGETFQVFTSSGETYEEQIRIEFGATVVPGAPINNLILKIFNVK